MQKDYDNWLREKTGEVESFVVAGQTFTPRARIPHGALSKVLDKMSTEEDESVANEIFFNLALKRADRERFVALLRDDDNDDDEVVISTVQVNQIVTDLLEFFTGKSTPKDSSSTPGPDTTGDSRNVISLNPQGA